MNVLKELRHACLLADDLAGHPCYASVYKISDDDFTAGEIRDHLIAIAFRMEEIEKKLKVGQPINKPTMLDIDWFIAMLRGEDSE